MAYDYAVIGLPREELLFVPHSEYKHRDKHIQQHKVVIENLMDVQELAQKIQSLKEQIPTVPSPIVLRRVYCFMVICMQLHNILNEWLSVHVLVNDVCYRQMTDAQKVMITTCVPSELLRQPDCKRQNTETDSLLFDEPNCLSYLKKYQLPYKECCKPIGLQSVC